ASWVPLGGVLLLAGCAQLGTPESTPLTVRGQSPYGYGYELQEESPGQDDLYRGPMNVVDATSASNASQNQSTATRTPGSIPNRYPVQQTQFAGPYDNSGAALWQNPSTAPLPAPQPSVPTNAPVWAPPSSNYGAPNGYPNPNYGSSPLQDLPAAPPMGMPQGYGNSLGPAYIGPAPPESVIVPPDRMTDIDVIVPETQTGRLMVGAAVNSDAGVVGQITLDEKNFDWRAFPRSWDDVVNGYAFRGGAQTLRIEAVPGSQVQRYMFQFGQPYLGGTRFSSNFSAFLFDRRYFDWNEQRLGGRLGLGYRVSPDVSLNLTARAEEVTISNPRVPGVPELDDVLGSSGLYGGSVSLLADTRDIPFSPTQGYLFEAKYEQIFGDYDYGRVELDIRRYFLLTQRPDFSGRHVFGLSHRLGFSGSDTPMFENYFAGGYSTLRGFEFRGASPQSGGVTVGGRFQLLGSAEYYFPITADDMLKGVLFCDYGTVERNIEINGDNFRVSLGAGLRVAIPAFGPAPMAFDFAVPVARADDDRTQLFTFFLGVSR
ncbi:MAG: BamA/TamA family outer membrane protein, partial [Planctomycetales bacterium]|nr:BamA/TamA family outer membrane protein [Planctomycetales bacterium]